MSYLFGQPIDAAAGDNQAMAAILRAMQQKFAEHDNLLGVGVNSDGTPTSPILPPTAQFTVTGVGGRFIVDITNPQNIPPQSVDELLRSMQTPNNQSNTPIYHRLQSALDLNFDANSSVTEYTDIGGSTALHYDLRDPNVKKYWRIASSYDRVSFNDWLVLLDSVTCGNALIWSGLVTNSESALVDSATTPQGTSPLTQSGTTKTINVAASIWNDGDQVINYGSGSVTPAAYGQWLIYAVDQFRAGGTVTFVATQNSSDITASLYNVYFGMITTAAGGGGTGSGGGGGTCCRAGVPYRLLDGTPKDCSLLTEAEILKGVDGGPERIERIDVMPARPCFRLEFDQTGKLTKKDYIGDFTVYRIHLDRSHTYLAGENSIIDGACSEHIIQYAGGGFVNVFEAVVGEVFSLQSGACGSHNLRKF
jgi:hypothetical protein